MILRKRVSKENSPAAQYRSNIRITKSPFWTSGVIADSGKNQRKLKIWLKTFKEIKIFTLPKISPQIVTNCKEKCTFLVERPSSHQLCISNTETVGHYMILISQHHLWSNFGDSVCYRLDVCAQTQNSYVKTSSPGWCYLEVGTLGDE